MDRITPYEGPETYIFISYSHKDTDVILPILQEMKEAGFRFWYDEGIDPGSEWPESIADHLNRCKVCLAFMSLTSLQSNNCKREINFALSKNKDFLSVVLEPVELTPGVEMQISTYQSIFKYKYRHESEFLKKFFNVETLQSCREMIEEEVVEVIQEEKKIEKKPKVKKVKPKKQNNNQFVKIALCIAFVVVGFFGFKMMNGSNKSVQIANLEIENKSIVSIENVSLTNEDMVKLSELDECTSISFKNCQFKDGAFEKLNHLAQINTINVKSCQGITHLGFLNDFEKIYNLTLVDCGITDEMILEYKGENGIVNLNLNHNQLKHIPQFGTYERLRDLSLENNQIVDIKEMNQYEKLMNLYLTNNKITSLDSLSSLIKLRELKLGENKIEDLSPIMELREMQLLDISNNKISDIKAITYFSKLEVLDVSDNNNLEDLSPLKECANTLTKLNISNTAVIDLDGLKNHDALIEVHANHCQIKDISGLAKSVTLKKLTLANNQIQDISALSQMTLLSELNLENNQINSLAGLENMSKEAKYMQLNLANNHLNSLKGLPAIKYYSIALSDNPLVDISALENIGGNNLSLDISDTLSLDALSKSSITKIYVTSIDISRKNEIEELLKGKVEYISSQEMIENCFKDYFKISF